MECASGAVLAGRTVWRLVRNHRPGGATIRQQTSGSPGPVARECWELGRAVKKLVRAWAFSPHYFWAMRNDPKKRSISGESLRWWGHAVETS